MAKIKVVLDGYTKEDGTRRVVLRYGKSEKYPTGLSAVSMVDGVIVGDRYAKTKNKEIAEKLEMIEEMMLQGVSFRRACERAYNNVDRHTVLDVWDEFSSTKSEGTQGVYDTARKCLVAYKDSIGLAEIDRHWLEQYDHWMEKQGLKTNTRSIRMRCLRAVLNYAIDQEYIIRDPFRGYKIKQEETEHRCLTVEQLRTLRDYPVQPFQERYVDIFMLCFYLIGINMVDLFSLAPDDYKNGYITYRRAKTHKLYKVKVEPEADAILAKYKGETKLLSIAEEGGYKTFAHLMAEALKRIGEWEGCRNGNLRFVKGVMPDGLSAYWARHTWATIASGIGVPMEVIAEGLGHSNGMSTTSIYIKFDRTRVDKANRKVLDFIK